MKILTFTICAQATINYAGLFFNNLSVRKIYLVAACVLCQILPFVQEADACKGLPKERVRLSICNRYTSKFDFDFCVKNCWYT